MARRRRRARSSGPLITDTSVHVPSIPGVTAGGTSSSGFVAGTQVHVPAIPGVTDGGTSSGGGYTPSTPAATPYTPNPYAELAGSILQGATAAADKRYGYNVADLNADENQAGLDYGFTLGRDDGGNVNSYNYDPASIEASNPYSKAGLLERSYRQQQNRSTNSYAASGQLYSGALQNAKNEDLFGYGQGKDALTKALQSIFTQTTRGKRDAGLAKDDTIRNATYDQLLALIGGQGG